MLKIGSLVNTHGIKGEVRIKSSFKYKDIVFNNCIYIDDIKLKITSYRVHKNYDMVTFEGYNNINDVLKFKGKDVYIDENDYVFPGILNESLYGKKVYSKGKFIGFLKEIVGNGQEIMVIQNNNKEYLIPYVDEFVKSIDNDIEVNVIKGLLDED